MSGPGHLSSSGRLRDPDTFHYIIWNMKLLELPQGRKTVCDTEPSVKYFRYGTTPVTSIHCPQELQGILRNGGDYMGYSALLSQQPQHITGAWQMLIERANE